MTQDPNDLRPMRRTEIGLWLAALVGVIALVEFLGKGVIGISLILLIVALGFLSLWAIGWALVKLFRGEKDENRSCEFGSCLTGIENPVSLWYSILRRISF